MADTLRRSKRVARPVAPTTAPSATKPVSPVNAKAAKVTALKQTSAKATTAARVSAAKFKSVNLNASKMSKAAPVSDTMLDHQAYPHIFELILEHAPYASLLALRAACTTLRKTIDSRIGGHLVIRAGQPPPKGAKWAKTAGFLPRGPAKQRPRQTRVNVAARDGQLPGWVCDYLHVPDGTDSCGDDCTLLRQRWEEVFANAEIIDVHPWMSGQARLWQLKDKFPARKVVRSYPYEYMRSELLAETMVIFTTFENPDPAGYAKVVPAPTHFIDDTVRRVVVHTTYDCKRPMLNNCWVTLPMLDKAEDVVLIFEPIAGAEIFCNPSWPKPQRDNGWLWDVVSALRVGSKVRFVIVGALEAPQHCVGVTDGVERNAQELAALVVENVLQHIKDDHFVKQSGGLSKTREEEIREQLRFVSVVEYRRKVGEEQWALEAFPTEPW